MLGRVIYRNTDGAMTADIYAALAFRYPTKGLGLERDGELHLIKAAGNTDVLEAFIAGVGWEQNRAAEDWISANERKPSPFQTVVLWVTGGPLHHGEDYMDVGCVNRDGSFIVSMVGQDVEVPVSHWMELKAPREAVAMAALCGDEAMDSNGRS